MSTTNNSRLQLKKLLNNKRCLFNCTSNKQYYNPAVTYNTRGRYKYSGYVAVKNEIEETLLKYVNDKYEFIQEEFDQFITCATFMKTKSYIQGCDETMNSVIATLFKKFTPDSKQLKQLLACYNKKTQNYKWVEVLLSKKYKFTILQKNMLIKSGYPIGKLNMDEVSCVDYINMLNSGGITLNEIMNTIKKIKKPITMELLVYATTWNSTYRFRLVDYILTNSDLKINTDYLLRISSFELNTDISNLILKHIDIKDLDDDTIEKVLLKHINYSIVILLIEAGMAPTTSVLNTIINNNYLYNVKSNIVLKKKDKTLMKYIDYKANAWAYSGNMYFNMFKYLFARGVVPDINTLKISILKLYPAIIIQNLIDVHKIIPTIECLEVAIQKNNLTIVDSILNTDIVLDICFLHTAISGGSSCNIISKLLTKIIPTKETLDKIVAQNRADYIPLVEDILNYKILPDKETYLQCRMRGINELLISYGLAVDLEIVAKSIENKDCILHLQRFNIPYDGKLYYYCHRYNNFPPQYKNKFTIDKKIFDLRDKFKMTTQWAPIEAYLKQNKLKVDRYCFENAGDVVRTKLVSLGAKPTIGCILKYIPATSNGRKYMDQLLSDKYETMEELEETYDIEF